MSPGYGILMISVDSFISHFCPENAPVTQVISFVTFVLTVFTDSSYNIPLGECTIVFLWRF